MHLIDWKCLYFECQLLHECHLSLDQVLLLQHSVVVWVELLSGSPCSLLMSSNLVHKWPRQERTTVSASSAHSCIYSELKVGTWRCQHMETLSTLLAHCGGNPWVNYWWIPLTKGQWCRALTLASLLAWTRYWTNHWVASDLRWHIAHVTSMQWSHHLIHWCHVSSCDTAVSYI